MRLRGLFLFSESADPGIYPDSAVDEDSPVEGMVEIEDDNGNTLYFSEEHWEVGERIFDPSRAWSNGTGSRYSLYPKTDEAREWMAQPGVAEYNKDEPYGYAVPIHDPLYPPAKPKYSSRSRAGGAQSRKRAPSGAN